jgi:hypothetical protein
MNVLSVLKWWKMKHKKNKKRNKSHCGRRILISREDILKFIAKKPKRFEVAESITTIFKKEK